MGGAGQFASLRRIESAMLHDAGWLIEGMSVMSASEARTVSPCGITGYHQFFAARSLA
jgi:hypothetical protein